MNRTIVIVSVVAIVALLGGAALVSMGGLVRPEPQIIEKEVIKEVPKEVLKEVQVVKEVPKEVIKEVVKEVPLQRKLVVVATTFPIYDFLRNIGGDKIDLQLLIQPGAEFHDWEPSPSALALVKRANVLVYNGAGLEPWLDTLLASAANRELVTINVSDGLKLLRIGHVERPTQRLLVGDGVQGLVSVVDLGDGEVMSKINLPKSISPFLYSSGSGRYAFVVQRGPTGEARIIDGGIFIDDHGDHKDLVIKDAALLDFTISHGHLNPSDSMANGQQFAVFFNANATAMVLRETEIESAPKPVWIKVGGPQREGPAIPWGNYVLININNPANPAPPVAGMGVYTIQGQKLQEFLNCPRAHGTAIYHEKLAAVGCADGILLLEPTGASETPFKATKLTFPADFPAGSRISTVVANEESPYLLGNLRINELARIDPKAGTITRIMVPGNYSAFDIGPEGQYFLALTTDGRLHAIDPETGKVVSSMTVMNPFATSGAGVVPPAMVVGHERVYISDPNAAKVYEINAQGGLSITKTIDVEGKPRRLALVGVPHEHAEGAVMGKHGEEHGDFDPHVWVDPINVKAMVEKIRNSLMLADPANKDLYLSRADAYTRRLDSLHTQIASEISRQPKKDIVTFHSGFSYFAQRYGLTQYSITGADPHAEPSIRDIQKVVNLAKEKGIKVVFAESLHDPRLSQIVAKQLGGKALTLDPVDGISEEEFRMGVGYIEKMMQNLANILEALRA
jgi:ABC-type Zn uptake system ZnuABC Zn-binding protein ZnuA